MGCPWVSSGTLACGQASVAAPIVWITAWPGLDVEGVPALKQTGALNWKPWGNSPEICFLDRNLIHHEVESPLQANGFRPIGRCSRSAKRQSDGISCFPRRLMVQAAGWAMIGSILSSFLPASRLATSTGDSSRVARRCRGPCRDAARYRL